jgi:hypothetical protein
MTLRPPHSDWRLPQVSVIDVRFVGLDQMLTRLWLRVLFENRPLATRVDGLQAVAELAHLMERPGNEQFIGFAHTGVAEAWLRADLVKTLKRHPEKFTIARPVHDRAVRLRNPREDNDSSASLAVYGWLYHRGGGLLGDLRDFLAFDPTTEEMDVATLALGILGDQQAEDVERSDEPEPAPSPLCSQHATVFADDMRRLLCYRAVMPRADLVDHVRRLTGLHVALYLLKMFRIAVDAETSGGTRTPCDDVHNADPTAVCPYQPELLVDCGEDARSPIAKLAEVSWAGEEEWLARYIRSHLALKKLSEFAEQQARRHPKESVPADTIDEIGAVERNAKRARLDAYFSQRFDDLVRDAKEVAGKKGVTDKKGLAAQRRAREQAVEVVELESEYAALGLTPFRSYIALLSHYSEQRWLNYHRFLLDSLFGKNSPEGMLRQPLGGRRRRRLSMAPDVLETLTLIAVIGDSPHGYVSRPLRVDELIARLDRRYGLLIGRPPTPLAGDPTIATLLTTNVHRFKARLRETGLYTDLSDAFLAQTVRPRYAIGASA